MKNFKKSLYLFAVLLMASCSEDYLETSPTNQISDGRIIEISEFDAAIFDGTLNGVYAQMFTPGSGGTGGHDDLGHRGLDIFTDMVSSDMALLGLNYGWYRGVTNYTWLEDNADNINYVPWRYLYRVIQGANTVIDGQGGTNAIPETPSAKYVMGQAKAMRAYAYLYLANILVPEYNSGATILPLYDSDDDFQNKPQVPLSDIYGLIESDLTEAVDYLGGFVRDEKFQINQAVAQGLLAYAYAAQGRYDLALPQAMAVANSGEFAIVSGNDLTGGFNDSSVSGWMWGIDVTPDMGLNLRSWWGQMDIYTYSYAWAGDRKGMDSGLFAQMAADDYRIDQYHPSLLIPWRKFYNPDLTIGGSSADNNLMDLLYMRVSEMVLLAAESAAKTGDVMTARTMLKKLMVERVPDVSYIDGLSGQALIDEITLQTRLELWGEGKSYFLMKRNKETRTRGANHVLLAGETISYNEPRVSFLVPQQEIQNNPFIN